MLVLEHLREIVKIEMKKYNEGIVTKSAANKENNTWKLITQFDDAYVCRVMPTTKTPTKVSQTYTRLNFLQLSSAVTLLF